MANNRGRRLQRVAPRLNMEQKASLEVADPKGFKTPATSGGIADVT